MGEILIVYLIALGIICAVFGVAELFSRTHAFEKIFRWFLKQMKL